MRRASRPRPVLRRRRRRPAAASNAPSRRCGDRAWAGRRSRGGAGATACHAQPASTLPPPWSVAVARRDRTAMCRPAGARLHDQEGSAGCVASGHVEHVAAAGAGADVGLDAQPSLQQRGLGKLTLVGKTVDEVADEIEVLSYYLPDVLRLIDKEVVPEPTLGGVFMKVTGDGLQVFWTSNGVEHTHTVKYSQSAGLTITYSLHLRNSVSR